jgi:hypothetical protein
MAPRLSMRRWWKPVSTTKNRDWQHFTQGTLSRMVLALINLSRIANSSFSAGDP